jgi:hypothetical protein
VVHCNGGFITDGSAEFALGQDGTAPREFVDGFLEPPVDHAAFGGAHGFALGEKEIRDLMKWHPVVTAAEC